MSKSRLLLTFALLVLATGSLVASGVRAADDPGLDPGVVIGDSPSDGSNPNPPPRSSGVDPSDNPSGGNVPDPAPRSDYPGDGSGVSPAPRNDNSSSSSQVIYAAPSDGKIRLDHSAYIFDHLKGRIRLCRLCLLQPLK